MSVAVTGIIFDHSRGQPGAYTVPLRFNEVESVLLPEWQRGNRFPSVAAYMRDRLPLIAFVLVRFAISPGEVHLLEIRARAQSDVVPLDPPLLPDLPPTHIWFNEVGDSGWCPFPLDTTAIAAGINAATQRWIWQFRRASGEGWIEFDATIHRIYVLLSAPTAPWLIAPAHPANMSLPRTDALDFACSWARGARNDTEVATQITEAIYQLGGTLLFYDGAVGAPHYTVLGVPRFLCDLFLDRLRGGEGAGPLVNCSDCATIVSTFANLLGADLWQSKMGLIGAGFRLNPIFAIGGEQWSTLFGSFGFHEVAWSGECTEWDTVYDACLQTDKDRDPTRAPHIPFLPSNQIFGIPGSGHFRDQIAAPPDRDKCAPRPELRVRRPISPQSFAVTRRAVLGFHLDLARRMGVQEAVEAPSEDVHFAGFFFFGNELPGWSLTCAATVYDIELPALITASAPVETQFTTKYRVLIATWKLLEKPSSRLRVESIETASRAEAYQTLIRTASEIENVALERWERGVLGEIAFKSTNNALVLFTRGNYVHIVRSAGRDTLDVRTEVETLDRWLMNAGSPLDAQSQVQGTQMLNVLSTLPQWRRYQIVTPASEPGESRAFSEQRILPRPTVREYVVLSGPASGATN